MKPTLKKNNLYSLNDILDIGKYKGLSVKDVIDKNPKYIEWLKNNAKNNFELDNNSINYLVDKLVINSLKYVKNKIKKKYGNN